MMAMMDWVETGRTVTTIIVTMWKDAADATDFKLGVQRKWPLYLYPQRAVYKSAGDTNSAACRMYELPVAKLSLI